MRIATDGRVAAGSEWGGDCGGEPVADPSVASALAGTGSTMARQSSAAATLRRARIGPRRDRAEGFGISELSPEKE